MKNKKAISVLIGYVLLISFAIILGIIVYQWMKTYVPSDELDCPEGVSIFIKDYSYDCDTEILTIYLKNTGKFNLGGYYIYATIIPEATLATLDLSKNNTDKTYETLFPVVKFGEEDNSLEPGEETIEEYDLTGIDQIYSIEILPVRWQVEKNKRVLANCKNIKIKEVIICKELSTGKCIPAPNPEPEAICGAGAECGFAPNGTCGYVSCGSGCEEGEHCDATYKCVSSECEGEENVCLGRECGLVENNTCGYVSCGTCDSGETCNSTGQCILNCGNGILDLGEQCDDGNNDNGDGCSSVCMIESGWTCDDEEPSGCIPGSGGSGITCLEYCLYLELGYTSSSCLPNSGQCTSSGGDYQSGGDFQCASSPSGTKCCCFPAA